MKRCPRCKIWKCDAVFSPKQVKQGRCSDCCMENRRSGHRRVKIRTVQAAPIAVSKDDAKVRALAKRELKKFRKRGATFVTRPYVFIAGDPAKGVPTKRF